MKRFVSVFLCLILVFSFAACSKNNENSAPAKETAIDYKNYTYTKPDTAAAAQGSLGGDVVWEFYDNGSLFVEGTGNMPDWAKISDLAWRDKIHSIKSVYIGKGITSIGDFAFAYCLNLTKVYIPDTVTSVGNSAFIRCEKLKSIQLPPAVSEIDASAFAFCLSLDAITIPETVTAIGDSAFSGCTAIKEISVPDNVSYVGNGCFAGWKEEQKITVNNSESYISENWSEDWDSDCSAPVHINHK